MKGPVLASTLPTKSLCFQLIDGSPVLLTPGRLLSTLWGRLSVSAVGAGGSRLWNLWAVGR